MKPSEQTNPCRSENQAAPQRKQFPAQKAALLLASFLSGCGAASQSAQTETNGSAEMIIVAPDRVSQPLRERLAPVLEGADQYRVYPSGREGNFGSASGGWTFRIIDSESSERAGMYFYELFPNRSIMGSGESEPVGKMVVIGSINPNFNVPLQPSEYTTSVGSDVFIWATSDIVIFRFFNPNTGIFERRVVDFMETEEIVVPAGATICVVYKPDEKMIEVYYIASENAVRVQFSLLTTSTSACPVE